MQLLPARQFGYIVLTTVRCIGSSVAFRNRANINTRALASWIMKKPGESVRFSCVKLSHPYANRLLDVAGKIIGFFY